MYKGQAPGKRRWTQRSGNKDNLICEAEHWGLARTWVSSSCPQASHLDDRVPLLEAVTTEQSTHPSQSQESWIWRSRVSWRSYGPAAADATKVIQEMSSSMGGYVVTASPAGTNFLSTQRRGAVLPSTCHLLGKIPLMTHLNYSRKGHLGNTVQAYLKRH